MASNVCLLRGRCIEEEMIDNRRAPICPARSRISRVLYEPDDQFIRARVTVPEGVSGIDWRSHGGRKVEFARI